MGGRPFSPSRRLAVHGGALIRNIVLQALASGKLGHPWPALGASQVFLLKETMNKGIY